MRINKKRQIIIFANILILSIMLCGIFLRFHMITDTYMNIGQGYKQYKIQVLSDGRIVNYIILSIAELLKMPFNIYQLLMMASSILLYSFAVYNIYNYLIEKSDNLNKIKQVLCFFSSFLVIFNPMTVETFAYTELVIPLSLYLCTKAAIILDKNEKKSSFKLWILIMIACLSYQGTINFFITFSILLFSIRKTEDKKIWIKQLIKIAIISAIALIVMWGVLHISNMFLHMEQTRIGNQIALQDKIIRVIIIGTALIIMNTYNFYQNYLILTYIIMSLIIILLSNKNKTSKTILKYIFLILVSVLSCIIPMYLQTVPIISARMSFSIGAIIGNSIIFVLFQKDENTKYNKIINGVLLIMSVVAIGFNAYNYINVGIMNIKTQAQEKIYAEKINLCILKYEEQTQTEITQVSFMRNNKIELTYLNMPANTFTIKSITYDYSKVHWLNYYTNRNLLLAEADEEIYYKYFKDKQWEDFNEEQIQFKNNTVYICIY